MERTTAEDWALEVRDLTVAYGRGPNRFNAVNGVGFEVGRGETLGIVGESGCGKSSIARALSGITPIAGGEVWVDGKDVTSLRGRDRRWLKRRVQLVFQDPRSSLNPRMTVGAAIAEGLRTRFESMPSRDVVRGEVSRLLSVVSLDPKLAERYPHQLSGGQCQRVAIARALAVRPEILLLDEVTSALDVSVQAEVLNLLRELQRELGLTMVFISHDLAVVRYMCSRILVMYLGQVVETRPTEDLFAAPRHPYTHALLKSMPRMSQPRAINVTVTSEAIGEPPDPRKPPTGCSFHPRCPIGPTANPDRSVCVNEDPQRALELDSTACHFPLEHQGSAESDDAATARRGARE